MKTPEEVAAPIALRWADEGYTDGEVQDIHAAITEAIYTDRAQRDDFAEGDPDSTPDYGPQCEAAHPEGWVCTRIPTHPEGFADLVREARDAIETIEASAESDSFDAVIDARDEAEGVLRGLIERLEVAPAPAPFSSQAGLGSIRGGFIR